MRVCEVTRPRRGGERESLGAVSVGADFIGEAVVYRGLIVGGLGAAFVGLQDPTE